MSRRSPPRARLAERRFPVRLRVLVPGQGLGRRLDDVHVRLCDELGPEECELHGVEGDMALCFRDAEQAAAFTRAFPDLALADRTRSG